MSRVRSSGSIAVLVLTVVFAAAACGSSAPTNPPPSVLPASPAAAQGETPTGSAGPAGSPDTAGSLAAVGSPPPFALSNVVGSVGVTAPEPLWKTMRSRKFKYTMAYPADWELKKASSSKKVDRFIGPEYATVGASAYKTLGLSLNEWTRAYLKYAPGFSGVKGFKLQSNKAATLAGAKARRLELKQTYKGNPEYWIDVLAVHGGKIYEVAYVSSKPITKTDRDLFDQFLATFHY